MKIELQELTYGLNYPIFIMDCKLGNRTYDPSEAGINSHRPDSLAKLQEHLPHLMKPEYYRNFSKKMLADIRHTVSSGQMLNFRIDVGGSVKREIHPNRTNKLNVVSLLQGIGKIVSKNTQPIMPLDETILWQLKYPPQLELALAIFTENRSKVIVSIALVFLFGRTR